MEKVLLRIFIDAGNERASSHPYMIYLPFRYTYRKKYTAINLRLILRQIEAKSCDFVYQINLPGNHTESGNLQNVPLQECKETQQLYKRFILLQRDMHRTQRDTKRLK